MGEESAVTKEPFGELELGEGDDVRSCASPVSLGDEVLTMRFTVVERDPSSGLFVVDFTIAFSVVLPRSLI